MARDRRRQSVWRFGESLYIKRYEGAGFVGNPASCRDGDMSEFDQQKSRIWEDRAIAPSKRIGVGGFRSRQRSAIEEANKICSPIKVTYGQRKVSPKYGPSCLSDLRL